MAEVINECDVVVIGKALAEEVRLEASRQGLSVMVLEADPDVGTPVHCGECLSLEE